MLESTHMGGRWLSERHWAGTWTSRLLISAPEATHATSFRLTKQREMPQ